MAFSIEQHIEVLDCAVRAQDELVRVWKEIELAMHNPDAEEALQNLALQAKSRVPKKDFQLVQQEKWKYSRQYIKRLEKERKRQRKKRTAGQVTGTTEEF